MSGSFERGLVTFFRVISALQFSEDVKNSLSYCKTMRNHGCCSCAVGELCQTALAEYLGISTEAVRQLLDKLVCHNLSFLGFKLHIRLAGGSRAPRKFISLKIEDFTVLRQFLGYDQKLLELERENKELRRKLKRYERSLKSLRFNRENGSFKFESALFESIKESLNGDREYVGVFERFPSLLGLAVFNRCNSILDLAKVFGVDLDAVLLALGALRKAGVIKDVKFV
jgi:DNA-binding Lrp family transcriptional regulator